MQPDHTDEHDKLHSSNNLAHPEPVFVIPLDMEPASMTPESHVQNSPPVQIQDNQLHLENTTAIDNTNSPAPNHTPNLATPTLLLFLSYINQYLCDSLINQTNVFIIFISGAYVLLTKEGNLVVDHVMLLLIMN